MTSRVKAKPHTNFKVANAQVIVAIYEADEQLDYGLRWSLPYLDLGTEQKVHMRVEFNPPVIHLSPLNRRQVENIGKGMQTVEKPGIDTLGRIIERRIESELAWMRRFTPTYKQLARIPAALPSTARSVALRALGLDALADYARFLTHYPPNRVWAIADTLRRASTRFIEPNLVDSRQGWERRLPPQGQLRRRFVDFIAAHANDAPISLFEILGGDSISLASVMELYPERFGPRRRLLKFSEDSLNEGTWDDLLGARVNGSLSPETSDNTERLMLHLLPQLEQRPLAAAYVLALMGFTLLGRPLGLTSLLDPQLGSTAIPETLSDDDVEHAYDLAAAWIEKNQ